MAVLTRPPRSGTRPRRPGRPLARTSLLIADVARRGAGDRARYQRTAAYVGLDRRGGAAAARQPQTVADAAQSRSRARPPCSRTPTIAVSRRASCSEFLIADPEHGGVCRTSAPSPGASVTAEAIDRTAACQHFAERLRLARDTARRRQVVPRRTPFRSSRRGARGAEAVARSSGPRAEFRHRRLVVRGAVSRSAFTPWRCVWRRRVRSAAIVLLLAVAHLLTAIGFAVLLSRPDPLRDTLLFVRYAEGVRSVSALMAALSFVDFAHGRVPRAQLPAAHRRACRCRCC